MAYRPTLAGTRHMVAAGHYLAAHAAFEILEAGGNAVDAGVAAGITMSVVQSEKVSFAGVAPIVVYLAAGRKLVSIDGLGTWPGAASAEYFRDRHAGRIPKGVLRAVVPAAADAWLTALSRYGTLRFADVARRAIDFAREGFVMYPFMANFIRNNEAQYRSWPSSAAVYLPGGKPPRVGDVFVQPDLAATLQFIADEEATKPGRVAGLEAARNAFYRGDIGARIAAFIRESGGLLERSDIAGYSVREEPMVHGRFRELDVYTCGPWCQGPVLLQMLNILSACDLGSQPQGSAQHVHLLVEAMKLAFADRHRYYGDPRFVSVPLAELLSQEYAARRRALIDAQHAHPAMPEPGAIDGFDIFGTSLLPQAAEGDPGAGDTSHVCVIDRHGNAFSATPSDGSGTMPVVPGTGLCPSARGSQAWTDPLLPAAVAPGKRPRLTPSPAMVLRDGAVFMPFGASGGDVQPQAMLQFLLNVVAFGMNAQDAVEAPRVASFSFPGSFDPHPYYPGRIQLESRFPAEVSAELAQLGHKIGMWPEFASRAGAVTAIVREPRTGILHGAADPRRPAYVLGW